MPRKKTEEALPMSNPSEEKESERKSSAMKGKGAFAAICYMASAVLLLMFNKAALSSYKFPCANILTLFQISCSCAFLYAMRHWKVISFTVEEQNNIVSNPAILVPYKILVQTLPLAITYLLYMLVSMESVRSLNIPMYTTLRWTTVAFTITVEYFLTGQKHSFSVVWSVGIIVLGAIVAGARDFSFDGYSYIVVFTANLCTAIYLASIARIGQSSGLNTFGLMWCNGIICGPILLILVSIKGDLGTTINFPHLFSFGFQVVILLSCVMAFLINYFVFLNTTLNSALAQTICSTLKDLVSIGLGWFLFGGLPYDLFNVFGISLAFLGSCLYAHKKLHER